MPGLSCKIAVMEAKLTDIESDMRDIKVTYRIIQETLARIEKSQVKTTTILGVVITAGAFFITMLKETLHKLF